MARVGKPGEPLIHLHAVLQKERAGLTWNVMHIKSCLCLEPNGAFIFCSVVVVNMILFLVVVMNEWFFML